MLVVPAIDLRGGKVVRLTQGEPSKETVYSDDPCEVLQKWQDEGAKWVHVVDLDGALKGKRENSEALERLVKMAEIPVQFGGGLRTLEAVDDVLKMGVRRVVIGTKAFDPNFLRTAVRQHHEQIAVGVDIRQGEIQTHGWSQSEEARIPVDEYVTQLQAAGVRTIIVTDIDRDGVLQGPNIGLVEHTLSQTKMNVFASGGISSLDDLKKLFQIQQDHFSGVVVGKALYEERFQLHEAINLYQGDGHD